MGASFDSVWVPRLTANFLTSYEGCLAKQWATPLCKIVTDADEFIKLIDLGTVGAVRQYSGPRQTTRPIAYQLTQQNLPWELTMEIDAEDVNRDKIGMWEAKASEIGGKYADHPTKLAAATIVANPVGFDGKTFFNTAHPVGSATAINNNVTSSQIPSLACATAATPTVVEAANQLVQLITYFYTFTDEAGDPINGDAREFLVVTSNPQILGAYISAIFSEQLTSGQTNPLKAGFEVKGWKIDAALEPRLGTVTNAKIQIFRKDSIIKPLIWGEERGMEILRLGDSSDLYMTKNKYLWGAKAVRSLGVGRWQHAIQATLS